MSKQQFLGEIKWVKETRQQRLVDFLESDSKLTPGSKQFLGEVKWLGDVTDTFAYKSCMANAAQGCEIQRQGMLKNPDPSKTPEQNSNAADNAFFNCINQATESCKKAANVPVNAASLQAQINKALAAAGICLIDADGVLGPTTCHAAIYVSQNLDQSVIVPAQCSDILQKGTSKFNPECKIGGGGGGGVPAPECSPTKPCPPGYECCQQGWTAGDFGEATPGCTPGKCVQKCPSGYVRGPDGACKAVATSSGGGSSSGAGLLILGAAALGLAFVASKSQLEKIPQRAAGRLQENKHGKRRPRRRRY